MATPTPPPPRAAASNAAADSDADNDNEWPERLYDFSDKVLRHMTPLVVILHTLFVAPMTFRVMPYFIDRVSDAQRSGQNPPRPPRGPLLPDFAFFGLSADALDQTFASYGPEGRQAYSDLLSIDVLFAISYGLWFGDVMGIIARLAGVRRRGPWRAAHLLPWLATAFDLLENALLALSLRMFDPESGRVGGKRGGLCPAVVSALASGAVQLKWAALALSAVALTLTLMRLLIRVAIFLGHYVCGKRGPKRSRGHRGGGDGDGGGGGGRRRRGGGPRQHHDD
jgi:hypothetical protein